jgi:hypothetical protein
MTCSSSMYPGRSSQGDYSGFGPTLCCAETYFLGSGGLLRIERELCCDESHYLGSGGSLWIECNVALRRIPLFGLWGIIVE